MGVILGGFFPVGNCPGASYPGCVMSLGGNFPGGNYLAGIIRVGVFMLPRLQATRKM